MRIKNKKYEYYYHDDMNNLKDMLELGIKKYPNNIAFSYESDGKIIDKTYQDVYDESILLSNYFYKHYKDEHIALISENSYNFIIILFGIVLSGNTCVIIDKDLDVNHIDKLLKVSDCKVIYYSLKYCSFVKDMKYKSFIMDDVDKYIKEGKKENNKYKIDDDKTAIIFFTSGTTGFNKAVMLSQKSIVKNVIAASSIFKPSGSVVSFLPFHHAFGLITGIFKPFNYGAPTLINSSLKRILDDFKYYKPETVFVVPLFVETFYKQIWRNARKEHKEKKLKTAIKISNIFLKIGIDLRKKLFKSIHEEFGGNLNYMICGGSYLDKKYVKWFRSIGINILNGYGITECAPVVSVNRNHHFRDGSIGQLCKDVEVKIIDGEICVKGDIIMNGYYKDKKATDEVIIDGYFHTGDLGYIDDDGFLFITGRKKNLIILSNGENISPEMIESDLLKNDAVCEVVVYDEDNKIIASIFPQEDYLGNQEYFDNLIYKYNKDKPKNHQIALVKLRDEEFIKNNNKKILRDKVKEGN